MLQIIPHFHPYRAGGQPERQYRRVSPAFMSSTSDFQVFTALPVIIFSQPRTAKAAMQAFNFMLFLTSKSSCFFSESCDSPPGYLRKLAVMLSPLVWRKVHTAFLPPAT
jgi:hypothetical protein